MHYKIQLIQNGTFSVDTSTINYINGSSSSGIGNRTNFSLISTFVDYNENIAIFEDSRTEWSGNFTLKENPQLDVVEFEFTEYDLESMTFAVELFFPSCDSPTMSPSSILKNI